MKKLFLLPIISLLLVGCGLSNGEKEEASSINGEAEQSEVVAPSSSVEEEEDPMARHRVEDKPKEEVELTLSNLGTYVAINNNAVLLNNSSTGDNVVVFYAYFIGADYCKFVDCTISYYYSPSGGGSNAGENTTALSLSGDGQATPFYTRIQGNHWYYFNVSAVTGRVLVYR